MPGFFCARQFIVLLYLVTVILCSVKCSGLSYVIHHIICCVPRRIVTCRCLLDAHQSQQMMNVFVKKIKSEQEDITVLLFAHV